MSQQAEKSTPSSQEPAGDEGRRYVHEVRYQREGQPERYFGAYYSVDDAQATADRMNKRIPGTTYSVSPVDVTGAFSPPPRLAPSDRFFQQHTSRASKPGCWDVTDVTIIDDNVPAEPGNEWIVARYTRNYPGTPPFWPFRQKCWLTGEWRHFALISPYYTASAVIALDDGSPSSGQLSHRKSDRGLTWHAGDIIAEEKHEGDCDTGKCTCNFGFCPVGFYVPDWHDVHDGSIIPGTHYWEKWDEEPSGNYGFVWGCVWGDDNGWKIQFLDLTDVQDGIIRRDDRFGYQYIDGTAGDPRKFIRVHPGEKSRGPYAVISTPKIFDITTGKHRGDEDWGD